MVVSEEYNCITNFILLFNQQRGGNLAMLAERFLHEVAFKLWKAPKYGA
jgi:hypothetical protein